MGFNKKTTKLLILLIFTLISCSKEPEKADEIKSITNDPPNLINYDIEDIELSFNKEEIYTNQNSINFQLNANFSFSKILFFNDKICQNLIHEEIFINNKNIILDSFLLNQISFISYKIKLNDEFSDCKFSPIKINHDSVSPPYPLISEYINNNYNGKTISNNIISIGGNTNDIIEDTSKIIISSDFNGDNIIGTFNINDYLSNNIIINLNPNSYNFLYLKAIDYHGNISTTNPISIIIEHNQNANVVNKPVLNQKILNLYNKYTSSLIFKFEGFLDFNSLYINIYSDALKNNLIKKISKSSFEASGLSVSLLPNTLNSFWLSASNDQFESELIEFKINHNDSSPQPPILDSSILSVHNSVIDVINAPIYGSVPPTIEYIYIYNNADLIGDPIFIINRDDFVNNTGIPLSLEFGNNFLYFVAIDFNSLQSDYVYIQVFVEE